MTQPIKVTRDSGANVKTLRRLERAGLIECHDVKLENGRENKKIKRKILPVMVWGHARWGEAVRADKDCYFDEISEIIGKDGIADAMHLEAHLRSEHDVFVTEDNDFLSKRDQLSAAFGCGIMTPEELAEMLQAND